LNERISSAEQAGPVQRRAGHGGVAVGERVHRDPRAGQGGERGLDVRVRRQQPEPGEHVVECLVGERVPGGGA
jgi:hypothetical protein